MADLQRIVEEGEFQQAGESILHIGTISFSKHFGAEDWSQPCFSSLVDEEGDGGRKATFTSLRK